MKKILFLLFSVFLLNANTYEVNTESKVGFMVEKFGFLDVEGSFSKFSGSIVLDGDNISELKGYVDASSINTDKDKRDREVVDVWFAKNTDINFESKSVSKDKINGTIAIKGVSKDIVLDIVKFENNNDNITLNLKGGLDRLIFGVGEEKATVGNDVEIRLNLIFNK